MKLYNIIFRIYRRFKYKLKFDSLIKRGLIVGKNISFEKGLIVDKIYPCLIRIGNNVTFSANCSVLAHDAGLVNIMGLVRVGKVSIGDNTFIGLGSTVLPGVDIGDNVIIGANSVVSKSIPPNSVAAGVPARVICSMSEYKKRILKMTREGVGIKSV